MRYFILSCALCCAGCASMRAVPQGAYSGRPVMQPGADGAPNPLQPSPDPAANLGRATKTPPGTSPTPSGETLTLTRPQSPPPYRSREPAPEAATIRQAPADRLPVPDATTRTPATVEPAGTNFAPTIPDPNAAVPQPGQVAGTPSGSAAANHQRVNTSDATNPGILSGWRPVSLSSGKRPIEMLQLGRGDKHLIVMGSLFGNERDSVEFVESLAELLQREPHRLSEYSIVLIRTPNPDGLADGTLTNSHGVALNRNFPSANFFTQRTIETGLAEASELETQTILHLCDDFRPDRVVHVRAGQATRVLVLSNAKAADGLRERIDRELMDGGEFEVYKAGSIEEYTTEKLATELLLLWLPSNAGQWRTEVARLAAVIIGPPISSIRPASRSPIDGPQVTDMSNLEEPQSTARPIDLFAPYEPPQPNTGNSQASAVPRGQKGYVEILPPPPEFAADEKGRDARFYELPPPE